MKIYLMTDLEGAAGVLDFKNWCSVESRYYELAKEFLTGEVNSAVEGFFAAGAKHVTVVDGHGAGGIAVNLLDARAEIMRGWPQGFPFLLDKTYDAIAHIGQHAKAGTEYAHLAHTQWFDYIDLSINGISIGEFGQVAFCAAELGVPCIFASGDEAFTKEATSLIPGIETVAVKRGTTPGKGDELDTEKYMDRNIAAVHLQPLKARELIRKGAETALRRMKKEKPSPLKLSPPFVRTAKFRQSGEAPAYTVKDMHPSSIIDLMNMPFKKTVLSP